MKKLLKQAAFQWRIKDGYHKNQDLGYRLFVRKNNHKNVNYYYNICLPLVSDKAVNLTECVLLPESNSIPFEIRSRTRRRNMGIISENVLTEHRSHDQDSLCNALKNSCCVVLQRLNDSDISCCKPSVDDLANSKWFFMRNVFKLNVNANYFLCYLRSSPVFFTN